MEEVKLDAKNIEDNKKKAIAQRLNINVEDIPQEIVDHDALGDLLIFGGEVKESLAPSARKIKSIADSQERYVKILEAAGFKTEEAEKLYELV